MTKTIVSPPKLPALIADKEVAQVVDVMARQYDMYVSEEFAKDLIAFVRELTDAARK